MRSWHGVPVRCLCPTHLPREFNEIKQAIGVARGEWVFDDDWHYSKLRGHVSRGQLLPGYLQGRLDALAGELARRGRRVPVAPTVPEWLRYVDHERLRPSDVREHNAAVLRRKSSEGACSPGNTCAQRLDDRRERGAGAIVGIRERVIV